MRIGLKPHHGICVPLFSLRSNKSCGIGEFFDLNPLIDWCSTLNLDCLQLLPLNDTGSDPSPYNPISSCALDPVYLSLRSLPSLGKLAPELEKWSFSNQALKFTVKQKKMEWLFLYFQQMFPSISKKAEYQSFLNKHSWLKTYALFKALKNTFGETRWTEWPLQFQSPEKVDFKEHKLAIEFHSFVQYLCFSQMEAVHAYANQKGIFIQGDIPILLSPDSADVWAEPSLFYLNLSAGAPPDFYNSLGQHWGFPLFNWDAMRQDGFSWWKRRLNAIESLFSMYRIDHVVGFFRIWAIGEGQLPIEGFFIPSDPDLWGPQGKELLEMMIEASLLLPIAEDLGTIPDVVYRTLKDLGICGTKVIRWQRNFNGDREFVPYREYEPLSMTTVSTPDMEPLQAWWQNQPEDAEVFARFKGWEYPCVLTKEKHLEILRDAHHTPSFFHINLLQEYLALFPELSWGNAEAERINTPGTLLPGNWTYRFRPLVEEIVSHQGLGEAFRKILN